LVGGGRNSEFGCRGRQLGGSCSRHCLFLRVLVSSLYSILWPRSISIFRLRKYSS
jgi:hypothetical protein